MDLKPVNKIDSDANTIRVSDGNSPIRLIFKDAKGEVINLYDKIDYFYLTKDNEKFYSVTDISYDGDEVIIRLPKLRKGKYKAEIRDKDGSIYPANEDLYILLRRSFEDDKDIYYFGHREDILNSVEPMVIQHIEKNPNKFKGERGQQGFPGRDGLRGRDGKDGEKGEKGDPGEDGKDGVKGDDSDGFISILSFNALGDGITDDTKAFENANSQKVNVYLPKGYVFVVDNLTIDNINIQGPGTLKRKDFSVNHMVRFMNNRLIENIKFIGNSVNQDNVNRTIIPIENAPNSLINNCEFVDFTSTLLNVYQSSPNVHITNCIFNNNTTIDNGNIITIRSVNCIISNNNFKKIGNGHCILLGLKSVDDLDYPVNNTIIKTNYFDNTEHNAITLELYTINTKILNNYFIKNPQAIKCEHEGNTVKNLLIDGNTFIDTELRTALNLIIDNVTFINNDLKNMNGGAYFGNNYICSNNRFNNVGAIDGYSISELNGAVGLIFNNIIENSKNHGILTEKSSVRDNIIINSSGDGLRVTGDGANISGNKFIKNKLGVNLISTVKNVILSKNNFKENINNISVAGSSRGSISIIDNIGIDISDVSHGIFNGTTYTTGSIDVPHDLGITPSYYNVVIENFEGYINITSVNSTRIRCTIYNLDNTVLSQGNVKLVWEVKK